MGNIIRWRHTIELFNSHWAKLKLWKKWIFKHYKTLLSIHKAREKSQVELTSNYISNIGFQGCSNLSFKWFSYCCLNMITKYYWPCKKLSLYIKWHCSCFSDFFIFFYRQLRTFICQKKFVFFGFINYLAALYSTLGDWLGGILTHPMFINNCTCLIWPNGRRWARNEVESKSQGNNLWGS